MFKGVVKYRPKELLAVYVETGHIEILRAHRQWRSWQMEPAERIPVSSAESIYESLQHLNLKPRHKKGSALVLFLPSIFYSVHREHYPASLQGQLEDALNFDWQENIFHEHDRSMHFFGAAVPVNHHLSVPIFSMPTSTYEKLFQMAGGSLFQTFAAVPSALSYQTFLPLLERGEKEEPLEIIARQIDPMQLEVHRFYQGAYLDSAVIGENFNNLKVFLEGLHCVGDPECREDVHIHLVCTDGECAGAEEYGRKWRESGIPLRVHKMSESLVSQWVRELLGQEKIRTFETELLLKPWRTPKVVWPVLACLLLYSIYTIYEVKSTAQLAESSKQLRRQVGQLETQWKPIEALQTRISKFQEDQKTLSEFNKEGFPLLEILSLFTQVTPDDTWLNYLSLRKGQLILRGESKSAIKYLSELSKVEGLADVRFSAPVQRNPTSDMERFNVQLQLDSEKLKKTLEANPVPKGDEEKPLTEDVPAVQPAQAPASGRAKAPPSVVAPEDEGEMDPSDFEIQEDEPPMEDELPEEE